MKFRSPSSAPGALLLLLCAAPSPPTLLLGGGGRGVGTAVGGASSPALFASAEPLVSSDGDEGAEPGEESQDGNDAGGFSGDGEAGGDPTAPGGNGDSADDGDEEGGGPGNRPRGRGSVKPRNGGGGEKGNRKKIDLTDLPDYLEEMGTLETSFEGGGKARKFLKHKSSRGDGGNNGGGGGKRRGWYGRSIDGKAVMNLWKGENGNVAGSMIDEEKAILYNIGRDGDGDEIVEEIDLTTVGDEDDPEDETESDVPRTDFPRRKPRRALAAASNSTRPGGLRGGRRRLAVGDTITHDNSGTTIDLMVLWTENAECAMSYLSNNCPLDDTTLDNMMAKVELGVEETNIALYLSGVDLVFRLVYAYRETTYTEWDDPSKSSSCSTALRDIKGVGDAYMEDVHNLRETYGADFVSLLVNPVDSCNGVAYRGEPYTSKSSAFSVERYNRVTGTFTFPHELGHNMGLNHDKGTKDACDTTAINYGYRDPQARFRSILSYDCSSSNQCEPNWVVNDCVRVQRYSNIHAPYPYGGGAGVPIGTQYIDNARHITEYKDDIASHYDTAACSFLDDCDDGNACTSDVCNGSGFCVHTVQSECCGNGECEGGETYLNCEADCAYELETTFAGSSTRHGNMFDVTALEDVTMFGMEINVDTMNSFDVEVWTKTGSYGGHNSNQAGWTQVLGPISVTGKGRYYGTPLPNFDTFVGIQAGNTQAFYVYSTSSVLESDYSLSGAEFTVFKSNNDLHVHVGLDHSSSTKFSSSPGVDKIWNGVLKYLKGPAETGEPTMSKMPTGIPTSTPTKEPTDMLPLVVKSNDMGEAFYGECQGDCDLDSDCIGDLVCFQRSSSEPGSPVAVPGCLGLQEDYPDTDFCFSPTQPVLTYSSDNVQVAGGHCHGDCDTGSECPTGMICYERSGVTRVPGCDGTGISSKDYCVDPNYGNPTNVPTNAPTSSLTNAPTSAQTDSPTSTPTLTLTESPTSSAPTSKPTSTPTSKPTSAPTSTPTSKPTSAPTSKPTSAPTSAPTRAPTSKMTSTPTSMPTNQMKSLTTLQNNMGYRAYGECQGDCDKDSDCEEGLVCFQRSSGEIGAPIAVPGCLGLEADMPSNDYCFKPTQPVLQLSSDETMVTGGHCHGDCDGDSECPNSLICMHRSGVQRIEGCDGTGTHGKDYCVDLTLIPNEDNDGPANSPIDCSLHNRQNCPDQGAGAPCKWYKGDCVVAVCAERTEFCENSDDCCKGICTGASTCSI